MGRAACCRGYRPWAVLSVAVAHRRSQVAEAVNAYMEGRWLLPQQAKDSLTWAKFLFSRGYFAHAFTLVLPCLSNCSYCDESARWLATEVAPTLTTDSTSLLSVANALLALVTARDLLVDMARCGYVDLSPPRNSFGFSMMDSFAHLSWARIGSILVDRQEHIDTALVSPADHMTTIDFSYTHGFISADWLCIYRLWSKRQ